MPDLLLIADSGPLIALAGVHQLDLLSQLYPSVGAPPAVIDEITNGTALRPGLDLPVIAPWLKRLANPVPFETLSVILGRGETEAIALARQEPNAILLMDDHQARRAAESLNLAVIGSAGILVRAKRAGSIKAVLPLLLRMRENGYYISNRVIERACREVGEDIL